MKTKIRFLAPVMVLATLASTPMLPAESPTGKAEPTGAYEEAARVLQDPAADDQSKRTSFETMKRLADEGDIQAIAALGFLYQEGIGTPKSATKACEWYRKAAVRGHTISMYNLARLLASDQLPLEEGSKDRKAQRDEAVEWYRKAADAGLDRARSSYGIILMRGDFNIKPSPAAAVAYLEPAAKSGDLEAMNALGTMYESGNGVAHSPANAEFWFRKAAEGGHLKARSNLAELLDPNSTDHKRRIEAIAWLLLAEEERDVVGSKMMKIKGQSFKSADMVQARKEAARIRRELRKSRQEASMPNPNP